MPEIEWGDNLVLGVPIIDNQHKRLIELMNELDYACLHDADAVKDALSEFIECTIHHFKTEEDLIEKHNYNSSPAHYHEHSKFLELIPVLEKLVRDKDISSIIEHLNIIRPLLYYHIRSGDKKLAESLPPP